jgi:hypothetical protein
VGRSANGAPRERTPRLHQQLCGEARVAEGHGEPSRAEAREGGVERLASDGLGLAASRSVAKRPGPDAPEAGLEELLEGAPLAAAGAHHEVAVAPLAEILGRGSACASSGGS